MNDSSYEQLREDFRSLISRYAEVYSKVIAEQDWKNPFRLLVSNKIPNGLSDCTDLDSNYKVEGSYGKGRWTEVPWVAIFDKRITVSAQKGVYIVYLINKEKKRLYLSLEIAATEVIQPKTAGEGTLPFTGMVGNVGKKDAERFNMKKKEIREAIPDSFFASDNQIDSGSPRYDIGTVYYKKYELSDFPSGQELISDLNAMIDLYRKYYEWTRDRREEPKRDTEEKPSDIIQIVDHVTKRIRSEGFSYDDVLVKNFYLCMKTKPFVILAGTSGTGKTKLVRLFAESIGAEYKLVSVRPDWSDSSDLFGHTDLQGEYVDGAITEFVNLACANLEKPHILCLDEMNLARVEYYLSDYLSLIETRRFKDDRIVTDNVKLDKSAEKKYKDLYLPENLYVVGTVNMDETTFPFSKKVLDRANTIEFSEVNLKPDFSVPDEINPISLTNAFLKTKYLVLTKDVKKEQQSFINDICEELTRVNDILLDANLHVGYRVRDEIVFYMLNNEESKLLKKEEAFDYELLQKILPRIQGSSAAVKHVLEELFKYCMDDTAALDSESGNVGSIMLQKASDAKKYPNSAKKIAYMMTRYEEDGFTSYWI